MALEWWTATRFYQVRLRAISRLQKYLLSSDISQPPKRAEIRKVQMGLYVQYGCGFCAPEGWVNFDASPTLRIEKLPIIGHFVKKNRTRFPANVRYGDIVLGLPISNGSADAVYASHVLEHLAREDFETALRNTHRMLHPGGVFRLIVPDLQLRAQRYLQKLESGNAEANDDFIRVCSIGAERRPRGLAHSVVHLEEAVICGCGIGLPLRRRSNVQASIPFVAALWVTAKSPSVSTGRGSRSFL